MPDLRNREKYEKALAAALALIFARWLRELEERGVKKRLRFTPDDIAELEKPIIKAGIIGAKQVAKISGMPWNDAMEVAAIENIRDTVVMPLVQLIEETTREKVFNVITALGVGASVGLALDSIRDNVLNASRINLISATEVTRSLSMGENWLFRQWRALMEMVTGRNGDAEEKFDFDPEDMTKPTAPFKVAFSMTPVWATEKDAKVCKICGPLDGKPADKWGKFELGPPAHPVCRCYLNYEVEK